MKKYLSLVVILLLGIIVSSDQIQFLNIVQTPTSQPSSQTEVVSTKPTAVTTPSPIKEEIADLAHEKIILEPEAFPDLYSCMMELTFETGPLAGNKTSFQILDKDYFENKGDKFFPGKNTAVYYDPPKYIILHSAFYKGNMLKPLEAEFIRYYLEYWGESDNEYVRGNIQSVIGSTVTWKCNGEVIFTSNIRDIVRLSQVASNQLWLEPSNLEQILINKEGVVSEWIGDMEISSEPTIYLGFCGWGPENSGEQRFAYYRYLINFDLEANP